MTPSVFLSVRAVCGCGWEEDIPTERDEICYAETVEDALRRARLHAASSSEDLCDEASRIEYSIVKTLYANPRPVAQP